MQNTFETSKRTEPVKKLRATLNEIEKMGSGSVSYKNYFGSSSTSLVL